MTNPTIPHSRPWITSEDRDAVSKLLASGMIDAGETARLFESEVVRRCGATCAVSQASGTSALVLALRVLGIADGDEVIIPTYVCRNVMEAVMAVGATPVLADVNDHGLLPVDSVRGRMSSKTRAIVAVHIFGFPCDVAALRSIGIPVIEDACQAFGLRVGNSEAGSLGDLGVFSFHATKLLTTGEGGMLVTSDRHHLRIARALTEAGEEPRPRQFAPLCDLQAALGRSQLARFDDMLSRRLSIAQDYDRAICGSSWLVKRRVATNCCFRYIAHATGTFHEASDAFARRGILVRRGVDELLHRTLGMDDWAFPNSVRLFESTVSIPCYPSLSQTEVDRIVATLRESQ